MGVSTRLVGLVLGAVLTTPAFGAEFDLDLGTSLVASDAEALDQAGYAVSLSGEIAVVGVPYDDHAGGSDAGAVYVYRRSGSNWIEHAKLVASDAQANDQFGLSVAVMGDTVLVGAWAEDNGNGVNAGSVYVFVRSGASWTEQAKLTASDGAASDGFGMSVALSGSTAVIGSALDDHAGGADAGSAYVFTRSGSTWSEQAKLVAGDASGGDQFGISVDVDGERAVVGAHLDDHLGNSDAGSAYIFLRAGGNWVQEARIQASDAASFDRFGHSASISGIDVAIGSPWDDHSAGVDAGSAYLFSKSLGWVPWQKLQASDAASSDQFGHAVSLRGDRLLVAAVGDDTAAGADAGSAYLFTAALGIWGEHSKLEARDAAAGDRFGKSVALDRDAVLLGAYNADPGAATNAGSAYLLRAIGRTRLLASDPSLADRIGGDVSLDGDTAVVGAPGDDHSGWLDAGSAYVFHREGDQWLQQARLQGSSPSTFDLFGNSTGLSGETLVVGAVFDDHSAKIDAGSATVFTRTGTAWFEQAFLTASDADHGDRFGESVAISADTIVVGARWDDNANGDNAGAVYVFVNAGGTWSEQAKLVASDGTQGDDFGTALSLSGDTLVVGANTDHHTVGPLAGSVYVFVRSGTNWSEQAKLVASDAAIGDFFGSDVDISGETVVVGAWQATHSGATYAGAAYVFSRSGVTWSERAKLVASDAAGSDGFGRSVSISGDLIVVGSSYDDHAAGLDAGSGYLFVRNGATWSEAGKLVVPDASAGDNFGESLAQSGARILVGAPCVDHSGVNDAGAADLFQVTHPWTDLGHGLTGISGIPRLTGDGILQSGEEITILLKQARSNALAALVVGTAAVRVPFKGGTMVPGIGTTLYVLGTDGAGEIRIETPVGPGLPSGLTAHMQFWIQDSAGPVGYSASNAVAETSP